MGLRHFSTKVCEKVKEKGRTNYNQVADELVAEYFAANNMHSEEFLERQKYDQKNIRRRVYDALNVLLAMNIICKRKKDIDWVGLPATKAGEIKRLEEERAKVLERIRGKKETIQELVVQLVAYKSLVWKNREMERLNTRPQENTVLYLPFVIINTSRGTTVDCAVSGDRSEFLFQFDQTFEVYDDFEMKSVEAAGNTFQFAEMNIRHTGNPEKTISMVRRAVRMGYDTVVINIDIGDIVPGVHIEDHLLSSPNGEDSVNPPPKKKQRKTEDKKPREQQLPNPYLVDESHLDLTDLGKQGKRFRQFSRVTFTLNDASVIHNVFNNPQLRQFDLVAVRPADVNILNTITRKTDTVDIITMNPETHVSWLHKPKFLEMIRVEGVGFEITYASALFSANRRSCLHSGRLLIRQLRRRGVVLSSGASSMCELRAPVDVMNMALLWGVSGSDARQLISGKLV
ncbi:hypothetical protein Angca_005773, partial [Angiostrongylus cantonensis]